MDADPNYDPLSGAILAQLVRKGVLDEADVDEIADRLEAQGEENAAHLARCALIRAVEPSPSEQAAQMRRRRFEIVPDGGKDRT